MLLQDENYCEEMNELLDSCNKNYDALSRTDKWEAIKVKASHFSKEFCKNSSKKKVTLIQNLYTLKGILCQPEGNTENDGPSMNTLQEVQHKIELLEIEQAEGVIFRSRCKWTRLGERNNAYFFSLEKCNYNNKTMFSILLNGQLCKEQTRILEEQ